MDLPYADRTLDLLGYCRVSSHSQEDGTSLETQEQSIRAYALANRWNVAEVKCDVETGSKIDRIEFWRMLRLLICKTCPIPAAGKLKGKDLYYALEAPCGCKYPKGYDGIVAYDLDRIGRDARDLLWLGFDFLNRRNKSLIVINGLGKCDTTSPQGRLMFGQFAIMAQFFRESTLQRTDVGRKARANEGKYACGRPPYGLQRTGKNTLTVVEPEMKVVHMIEYMTDQGWRAALVAEALNRMGLVRRNGKGWDKRSIIAVLNYKAIREWYFGGQNYNYVKFKDIASEVLEVERMVNELSA